MRKVLLAPLLAVLPVSMWAQHPGIGTSHFSGFSAPGMTRNGGFVSVRDPFHGTFNGRFGSRHNRYLLAFFDPFYADYLDMEYPVASEPPVLVPQAPPAGRVEEKLPAPAQPLLLELRGDHFVQLSGSTDSGAQLLDEPLAPESTATPEYAITELICRDGHREEVSNYTIVDGVLYASASYFSAGSWVRKIAISDLDLPETIRSNQARGVPFRLPQAANEVIVGP